VAGQDWNAIILILDTLSEGAYSFTELEDYVCRQHDREVMRESLELLTRQDLICVLEGLPTETPSKVSSEKRSTRIHAFFEIADVDRHGIVGNWVGLTDRGRDLLRLLGIGHP